MAQSNNSTTGIAAKVVSDNSSAQKPAKPVSKSASHHGFGTNMPMMSSAFDTAMWLTAA